jgi:carbonic anhydrase
MEGNKRYVEGNLAPKDVKSKRDQTKDGQKPFVTVVSCSDSRVVPEYIFDENLGEIFVIRTAGNIVDTITLGSIEYGVEHLGTPLLVVLGHEKCGAITAACSGGECPPNIQAIMDKLKDPVERGEKDVEQSVVRNALAVADEIRQKSEIVRKLEDEGKVKIVSMKYFFTDGSVEQVE